MTMINCRIADSSLVRASLMGMNHFFSVTTASSRFIPGMYMINRAAVAAAALSLISFVDMIHRIAEAFASGLCISGMFMSYGLCRSLHFHSGSQQASCHQHAEKGCCHSSLFIPAYDSSFLFLSDISGSS